MRATSDVVYQLASCNMRHAAKAAAATQLLAAFRAHVQHATCNIHTHFQRVLYAIPPIVFGVTKRRRRSSRSRGKNAKKELRGECERCMPHRSCCECHKNYAAIAGSANWLPAVELSTPIRIPNLSRLLLLLIPSCDFCCDFCEPAVWHVWHDVCAAALKQKAHSAHMCDDRGGMCDRVVRAGQASRQGKGRREGKQKANVLASMPQAATAATATSNRKRRQS